MQVRPFNSSLLCLKDQLESITNENDRIRLFQIMTKFSNQASGVERNQSLIKLIIKRYARTVGSDLDVIMS